MRPSATWKTSLEELLPLDFTSALVVALVAGLDVGRGHERLASATHSPAAQDAVDEFLHADDAEEPEAARRHRIFSQGVLRVQPFLLILDACLHAGMLLIDAEVGANIFCEVLRSSCRVHPKVVL